MITPVLHDDLLRMYRAKEIGPRFFEECKVPGTFQFSIWYNSWKNLLKANYGVMWKLEVSDNIVGALGGIVAPDLNDGELTGTEMFWYVLPEFKSTIGTIRLLETFEKWARDIGCKRIHISHLLLPNSEKFDNFIEKRGFKMVEVLYVKTLQKGNIW